MIFYLPGEPHSTGPCGLEQPARLFKQIAQFENDAALRRAVGDTIGLVTGLPSTAAMRAIEGAISDDVPLSEAVFGSNPLTR
ncbi:hypothetical protein N9M66_05385 [Litoreibacter sp.]|nr:hypothetical protein [Litoreibacter sp.]